MDFENQIRNMEFTPINKLLGKPDENGNIFVKIEFRDIMNKVEGYSPFRDEKGKIFSPRYFYIKLNHFLDQEAFKGLTIIQDLAGRKIYPWIKLIEWTDCFLCVCNSANFIGENYFKVSKKDLAAYLIENDI